MTQIRSSTDGRSYTIKRGVCDSISKTNCKTFDDTQEAANLLASVRHRMTKFVDYLYNTYKNDPKYGQDVRRLKRRFNPDAIAEGAHNKGLTTYTLNKGESINFCLRSRDSQHKLHDINTLMYVGIHEIVHLMEAHQNPKHTGNFKNLWGWALKQADRIGVWQRHDYASRPVTYCGIKIGNNII